jgi:hypothetical protein
MLSCLLAPDVPVGLLLDSREDYAVLDPTSGALNVRVRVWPIGRGLSDGICVGELGAAGADVEGVRGTVGLGTGRVSHDSGPDFPLVELRVRPDTKTSAALSVSLLVVMDWWPSAELLRQDCWERAGS